MHAPPGIGIWQLYRAPEANINAKMEPRSRAKEIKPLNLTPAEVDEMVAFLEALTGAVNNREPPASLPR